MMKEQIVKLMEAEGLTPAKFADEIGVQRSSISHIISGRNKPSYDFILKILNRFTGLNSEWLLTGRGSMIKSDNTTERRNIGSNTLFNEEGGYSEGSLTESKPADVKPKDEIIEAGKKKENTPYLSQQSTKNSEFTNVININYILVFFRDGTFKQYNSRE